MSVAIIAGIHPTIPRASGIRSYAVGLARGLSRVGEKVILVGVGPEASLDFASFQSVNPNYPVSTFTFVRSLARWIRHHPFERGTVLHGQRPDDLLPLMRLRGRPRIVCTVHGDPRRGILERHACLVRGLYRAAERKTLSRADHVICVSQTGLEVYLKRFPQFRRKISVIPVGIDLSLFKPLDRTAARRQLGLDDRPTIVFAGRLESEKRVHAVTEALRTLPDPPQLVVAGEGRLRNRLQGESDPTAVRFLGAVAHENMPLVLAAADALVLASAFEGLPTVALEALACGRPIIATRVGDLPLIIEEGRTGLFSDGAVLGLRDAVARLASLGNSQQSCERAAKRFGWDSVVPRVRETYYAVG